MTHFLSVTYIHNSVERISLMKNEICLGDRLKELVDQLNIHSSKAEEKDTVIKPLFL